jgi:hypothetical protein
VITCTFDVANSSVGGLPNCDPAMPDWMSYAITQTVKFLEELSALGFPYKALTKVHLKQCECKGGCVTMTGFGPDAPTMHITFPHLDFTDGFVIAHEMGHGLHERWRKTHEYGEDFANAVRWFVEGRLTLRSAWWIGHQQENKNKVLRTCDWSFDGFVHLLRQGEDEMKRSIKQGDLFTEAFAMVKRLLDDPETAKAVLAKVRASEDLSRQILRTHKNF